MILTTVLGIIVVFGFSYFIVKPEIVAWNQRGFQQFEKNWSKIFIVAASIAIAVALYAWWQTDYNATFGMGVGIMAGFFSIAAWTDAHVHKVPIEISRLTVIAAIVIGGVSILQDIPTPVVYSEILPTITNNWLQFLLICVGVTALGFFGFLRIRSTAGYVSLFVSFIGFFLAVYTLISGIYNLTSDPYWLEITHKLLAVWIFVGVIMLFDLMVGDKMGGADLKAMYAAGFAFAWWTSSYGLFCIMLAGFFLQFLLHLVATPLKIGSPKQVKTSAFRKAGINMRRGFKKVFLRKEDNTPIPETYTAWAVPFLPILITAFIGGVLVVL